MAAFQDGTTLLFHFATTAELGSCHRDSMTYKAESIYYLALYRKSLLNSDLRGTCSKTTYTVQVREEEEEEEKTKHLSMGFLFKHN